jgi:hypothetical protein
MVTDRARKLLLVSIPLFFLHGLEEGSTGILGLDPFFHRFGHTAAYVLTIELIIIALVLYLTAINWGGKKVNRIFRIVSGVLLLIETQHIYGALLKRGYYPGVFTALIIIGIGLYYWKDLLKMKKQPYSL